MKNIGIFGIGGIGSLLTKYLIQNTEISCFFFNRSPKEIVKIKFLDTIDEIPISLSNDYHGKLDWLLICLKEYQHLAAIPKIKSVIDKNTKLAIFQNGINLSSKYTSFVKSQNILETIIDCPVERTEGDLFCQHRAPKIFLSKCEIASEFKKLFCEKAVNVQLKDSFESFQWIKLIESSAIGSIQSYTEKPCLIFEQEKYLAEFRDLVEEGILVARSEGIFLDSDLKEKLLAKLKSYPKTKGSSMLSDKLAKRKLELNAKIGVIKRIADRNGLNVPTTQRVYKILV
jgi:2-dehydropantoate 2-reductase